MGILMCPHHGRTYIVNISQGVFDAIKNREAKTTTEICHCFCEDGNVLEISYFFTDEEVSTLPLDGYEAGKEGRIELRIQLEDNEGDIEVEVFPHLAGCGACFTEWQSIFREHNENYFVWGTVENISQAAGFKAGISARFAFIEENPFDPAEQEQFKRWEVQKLAKEQAQERTRQQQKALRRFFADKNLLTIEVFDEGNFVDREYRKNDFTAEGLELVRRIEAAWPNELGVLSSDIDLLEKTLKEIRTGK